VVPKAQENTQSCISVTSCETTEQEQLNFDLSVKMSTAERLGFENTGVTGNEDIAKVCAEWHGRQIKYLEQLLR
jgi:hypothetical protein